MAEGKKWRLPIETAHDRVAGAGEYVFVGSSGDFDAAGQIRHPNDLALQIVGAIGNLREALGEKGLDLGDVVRLKAFYTPAGRNGYWEVMARLRPRLSGLDFVDRAHDVDSSVSRAFGDVSGQQRGQRHAAQE